MPNCWKPLTKFEPLSVTITITLSADKLNDLRISPIRLATRSYECMPVKRRHARATDDGPRVVLSICTNKWMHGDSLQ